MAFQSVSGLFEKRSVDITDADIQYYVEHFYRELLHTDAVYCAVSGMGVIVRIRLHDPLAAQTALLAEHDVREKVKKELDCEIGSIRVMLE
ncbi:MAG: hypothetical protein K8Q97_02685 [Candidatus Andersenbacteria bacterium]|nr:hypothetical protein [Candidatus Andersenbacteria bacterium]